MPSRKAMHMSQLPIGFGQPDQAAMTARPHRPNRAGGVTRADVLVYVALDVPLSAVGVTSEIVDRLFREGFSGRGPKRSWRSQLPSECQGKGYNVVMFDGPDPASHYAEISNDAAAVVVEISKPDKRTPATVRRVK